jgi:alkanesulfonate monooxygenase SsuD/methylene tetrahydromethanopterin reductase-like flavin-dependent oxidoreductase (luciferase family)
MAMTFGCVLSQAIFAPTAGSEAHRTLAERAEALGFHAVWLVDHIVIPRYVSSSYPYDTGGGSPFDPAQPFYEPLSALNFLAGCTERVRLGTHVLIIPYRQPVYTAKILATLDALSGGRLMVGAGAGWMAEEFAALGLANYAEIRDTPSGLPVLLQHCSDAVDRAASSKPKCWRGRLITGRQPDRSVATAAASASASASTGSSCRGTGRPRRLFKRSATRSGRGS